MSEYKKEDLVKRETQVVRLGSKEVRLDPDNLRFNEATLSNYMETEAVWYDYFGGMLAEAEYLAQRLEHQYDVIYSERFKEHKENGCTEKLSEANAKADDDVIKAKDEWLLAKCKVKMLQQHLRAWDRAHENAQSRGHFLRKEMDKLNKDIHFPENYLERKLEEIVQPVDNLDELR